MRRIPVAVLTASSAASDLEKAHDLGARCFLTKPVEIDQFFAVVDSIESFPPSTWIESGQAPALKESFSSSH